VTAKVFKERWVNFIGDSKSGDGKFVYLSGDDQGEKAGFIIPSDKASGLAKGAKVTVKARKNGNNWDVTAVRVDAEPRAGGGGSGGRAYGGGGGKKADPKVQQSIVMQHSQTAAISLLGEKANISDVLRTSVILFAQAYGPGLDAAVEAAAEMGEVLEVDDTGDDFGDDAEDVGGEESDEDDDFSDDFDD
jgi:hypothetical protein